MCNTTNSENGEFDPNYFPTCSVECWNKDVYSSCDLCLCVLCKDHTSDPCANGHKILLILEPIVPEDGLLVEKVKPTQVLDSQKSNPRCSNISVEERKQIIKRLLWYWKSSVTKEVHSQVC